VLPIFGCLVIGGSALAWYNRAVTGEPLLLPHVAYQQQYFIAPNFLWGPIRPEPAYRHPVLAEYYLDLLRRYYDEHQWSVLLVTDVARLIALGSFFGAGLFFIPLVALGAALRDRWTRFAIGTTMILVLASLQVTYLTLPHYIAPAACLIAAVLLRTTRCLRLWHWKGRPIGRALVGALPIIFVTSVLMSLSIPDAPGWSMHRATIERKLERDGRRHLVVVRYAQDHNPHQEWVYNRADIDEAPVVWARDMGLDQNRRLLEHFGARRVWLLDADSEPPRIVRFPSDETEPPTTEENPFS
jgi:hypothetical protein